MLTNLVSNLGRQVGASVVHGQDDRGHLERRIQVLLDHPNVVEQLREPLQRVVLGLNGDENFTRCHEGIDGEQAKARRTINEDIVEPRKSLLLPVGEVLLQRARQALFTRNEGDQLDLCSGQVDRSRSHHQPLYIRAGLDHISHGQFVNEDIVDTVHIRIVGDGQRRGGVALGIDVNDQDLHARSRQGCREVDRRGGLADTALLIGHGDDARFTRRGQLATLQLLPSTVLLGQFAGQGRLDVIRHGRVHGTDGFP